MSDFLLELCSEEIPARMQVKAKEDLARLFVEAIGRAGLVAGDVETFATPRRLALIARGLPDATESVREETKGPKASAPAQAIEGFLRKTGLRRDQLDERDGTLFAVIDKPGRPAAEVLAEAIPAIVRAFPWPKSMRWGAASASTESLRWVRPLQGIVALLDGDVIPLSIDGIASGRTTSGHRFLHAGDVTIGSAASYIDDLRAAHVIVHFSERCAIIREGAARLAAEAGCAIVEDEGLVIENAGLTEWPVPLLGSFDPAFLSVPPEVIALTARTNQKYFVMRDADLSLAPRFVCVANIEAPDGGKAIVAGNERVLAARLSDAKFFWETDLKVPLEEQAAKLSQIVFHEKLGTVADKVERVAKLARWLCEEGIVKGDPHLAERAALLCKADLVTGMVGEFPELQGIIGGHLARARGEDDAVADAIRDHYKPVGQGDAVPTAPVTVAVSLADKFDTLMCFFAIDEKPTGSKDPFALRRAALSVIRIVLENNLRFTLDDTLEAMTDVISMGRRSEDQEQQRRRDKLDALMLDQIATGEAGLVWFFADRLKVQQREAGVRHDLIDAVFALDGEDDLVRLLARVKALQAFVETGEGADLLAAYKRAANILKQANPHPAQALPESTLSPEGEGSLPSPSGERVDSRSERVEGLSAVEDDLQFALNTAEPAAADAIAREDYEAAMSALALLRAPIDAFFEGVMVNDPDPAIRAFRLGLLARFRDAVHRVADFSKIEG